MYNFSIFKSKRQICILYHAYQKEICYYIYFLERVENALNTLIGIYTGSDAGLQLEAAWCITNISAGTSDQSMIICKQVAPYLVTYLSSGVHQLQVNFVVLTGSAASDLKVCSTDNNIHIGHYCF